LYAAGENNSTKGKSAILASAKNGNVTGKEKASLGLSLLPGIKNG